MRRLFILNPSAGAGRGRDRWRQFLQGIENQGIAAETIIASTPEEARNVAKSAANDYDLIGAAGGDGTVFEVVSGMLADGPCRAALAIVPIGTGNDAAEVAGITSLEIAGEAVVRGNSRLIDVIRVECMIGGRLEIRHALLFAAVGITSEVLRQTTPRVKRIFGTRLAYPIGLLRAVWKYRASRLSITCEAQNFTGTYLLVSASNTERAGGGMKLAPRARIDDGLMNLNLVDAIPPMEAVMQIMRVAKGEHIHHPKVRYFSAKSISIDADPPVVVDADGETIGETPARFEIQPGLLGLVTA